MPKAVVYADGVIYRYNKATKSVEAVKFDDIPFKPIETRSCSNDVLIGLMDRCMDAG